MSRTLLLVDGTNVVMRCAFGGDVPPDRAIPIAFGMVKRAAVELGASHLIVAFDSGGETWRTEIAPTYKANRTSETSEYSKQAIEYFRLKDVMCVSVPGFEADDCVATLAKRTTKNVAILSGDSDLAALVSETVQVFTPGNPLKKVDPGKYGHGVRASNLADYKALVGERGDNIAGVPGIGPKKAAALLATHGTIERLLAGAVPDNSREAALVRSNAEGARLALKLTTLRLDVPIEQIAPVRCAIPQLWA